MERYKIHNIGDEKITDNFVWNLLEIKMRPFFNLQHESKIVPTALR